MLFFGLMSDVDDIRDRTFAVLQSWAGYPTVRTLLDRFADLDVFVAGGIPRNVILNMEGASKDVDLFIAGDAAKEALAFLGNAGCLGYGPFGSPRWMPFEEEQYADVIMIEDFSNGLWRCEGIVDALNQFDFTVNAVAFDLRSGTLYDPQNGMRDAERRVMKAVRFDYPDEPFQLGQILVRPAIVWFRILHYAAKLRLDIEPVTLSWLRDRCAYATGADEFGRIFFPLEPGSLAPAIEPSRV